MTDCYKIPSRESAPPEKATHLPKSCHPSRSAAPAVERCEGRSLATTVVFIFNGDGYGAAKPDSLTANAAQVIRQAGDRPVQLAYPALSSPSVLASVARQIERIGHGQPVGLVGFSAGGSLAERLAGLPGVNAKAVLAEYSPPDLNDYLAFHGHDRFGTYVVEHGHFNLAAYGALSGPGHTSAHMVGAFGLQDVNIVAGESAASFLRDYPGADVYQYNGPHGVAINASVPALNDFLSHL